MKQNIKLFALVISMIILSSCDDSKTKVINTIHKNGSITRTVRVTKSKNAFEPKQIRVPIDSSWNTDLIFEVNEKQDTSWIFTAEKHFANVDELNSDYKNDSSSNNFLQRSASFSKKFRWFTSNVRFSETIEKTLDVDCPITDYLSNKELEFFYLPDSIQTNLKNGIDSLIYKELSDTIEFKSEVWFWTIMYRQWLEIFYELYENHPDLKVSKEGRESMRLKESQAIHQLLSEDSEEDQFIILLLGEEIAKKYKAEIDSSFSILDTVTNTFWSANKYDMEIRMPGKVIASNGYSNISVDSLNTTAILWTINPEFFLNQKYQMWVESRIVHYWTWSISGLLLIIITVFGIKKIKRGKI